MVTGGRKTELADSALLKALLEEKREPLKTGTKALSVYGTSFLVKPINTLGGLGSYNLRQETFADAQAISGEEMHAHYHDRDTTCLKCPVACGKQYEIRDGELMGLKAKMPEYETIFAFGSMLGNAHAGSLARANDLCDLLGMDTISMGVTLSFVAEALERGGVPPQQPVCRPAVAAPRPVTIATVALPETADPAPPIVSAGAARAPPGA